MRKVIYVVIAVLLIVIVWLILVKLAQDPIGVVSSDSDKSQRFFAYAYYDSGGGPAGWCQTKVAVLNLASDYPLSVVFGNKETVFYIDGCQEGYEVKWHRETDNSLNIRCPASSMVYPDRVFIKKRSSNGLDINYTGCPALHVR